MKAASFARNGQASWGIVDGEDILDVGSLVGADLKTVIGEGRLDTWAERAAQAERIAIREVTWLPVIPNPDKIFCVGLNYEMHRKETGRKEVSVPTIFARFANSQTGHLCPVVVPKVSETLDFEGELALVIGRRARNVSKTDASALIAGYAPYNDITVRAYQHHTHQFTPGKNFPGTGAFGPWMVTPDEAADLQDASLTTRLNGEVVQKAHIREMIFDLGDIVSYCSQFTQLEPGDVIVTGTPGGVGAKRTPPLWMKPGDEVTVEIDGVGKLVTPIVAEE